MTARLQRRLQSNPTPGADPVCRCENAPANPAVSIMSQSQSSALLLVDFSLQRGGNVLNFTAVADRGRWLVDDTGCGDPSSSIYLSPVRSRAT